MGRRKFQLDCFVLFGKFCVCQVAVTDIAGYSLFSNSICQLESSSDLKWCCSTSKKKNCFRKKALEDASKVGCICILDVELQGVRNIRKCGLDAKYILIRAPSLEILVA